MNQSLRRLRLLACFLSLATAGSWAQGNEGREEAVLRALAIVHQHNPALASQAALLREAEKLPQPRGGVAITGMSVSLATSIYDPDTGTYRLYPAATLGASISIADPARALNAFNLRKEREAARQEYRKIQNELAADLYSTVREILKLAGRRASLEKLRTYLLDYSSLIERQVRAGAATPELDKLWELKERLLGIEVDIQDVENQLGTMRLEAAMRLAGDSWQELLAIFTGLGGKESLAGAW